jgi:serine/threonine protein kinase/formylglycine-generating enzyme required for sulfatase activity
MDFGSQTGSFTEQIDLVCIEFESAWWQGSQPRIEDYLDRMTDRNRVDLFRTLLVMELEIRKTNEERPRIDEYLDRFPNEMDVVREVFGSREDDRPPALADVSTTMFRTDDPALDSIDQALPTTDLATPSVGEQSPAAYVSFPEQIGSYRLIRLLGVGGFGRVYQAGHVELGRDVAIKVARPGRLHCRSQEESLLEEARLASRLKHQAIVTVYDVGRLEGGELYVVLEYLEGKNLARTFADRRLTPERLARLIIGVAEAAHHAHQAGLVHRDLKPSNILIDRQGEPHVTDFGLALTEDGMRLRSGEVAGTPSFMAPEQVRGESHRLDGRTDLWAIGVIFYQGLTGRLPFQGRDRSELFNEILSRDPKPPRQIDQTIPQELERICLVCLSKRMTDRYNSTIALAEDLRAWLDSITTNAAPTTDEARRHSEEARPQDPAAARVIPRGLRAFGKEDAGFFLTLLPGPKGRDGLPESIRFWKSRIEPYDDAPSFSVGLLYGPSGGGKSSLVRAGLLPRLSQKIQPIFIEASPDKTEAQLLQGLKGHLSQGSHDHGLVEAMIAAREGGISENQKILIVIDQFEQWLFNHPEGSNAELIDALRQADGGRIQVLLLVRDDFWMGISRVFKALEIPLVEGVNSSAVEMFDADHARKVFVEFGRACGRLGEGPEPMEPETSRFLDQALAEMTGADGRVTPIRLSVFSEMMRGRPWTRATLRELGGVEGLGVRYLEETFDSRSAPPSHRVHARAAQGVLQQLLPNPASVIRGGVCSSVDLAIGAGYEARPGDFADLMQILDRELRIVTLVEPELGIEAAPRKPDEAFYQLSHDFLVGPIRQWVERQELATRSGRVRLRLASIAALWDDRPGRQRLPSILEWVGIRRHTQKRQWSTVERRMMAAADQHFLGRAALIVGLIAALFLGFEFFRVKDRASATLAKALKADFRNLPGIYQDLAIDRDRIRDDLERLEGDRTASPRDRDVALILLHRDRPSAGRALELRSRLRTAVADEAALIRDALAIDPGTAGLEELRRVLLSDEDFSIRLRAAVALIGLEPVDRQVWEPAAIPLVRALLDEDRRSIPRWLELLDPALPLLVPPLSKVCGDKERDPTTRLTASEALAGALSRRNDVEGLARGLTESQPDAALVLLRELERKPDRASSLGFFEKLMALPPGEINDDSTVDRQAMASVALALLGDPDALSKAFRHRADPRLRALTIRKIATMGLAPGLLAHRLNLPVFDPSERQAMLLALAETSPDRPSQAVKALVTMSARTLFTDDIDPGVHSASDLLLRRWEPSRPPETPANAPRPKALGEPRWQPGPNGHTLVVLPGPLNFLMGSPADEPDRFDYENRHQRRIDRSIAVVSTEVTVRQYRVFKPDHSPDPRYSRTLDDPVGGLSWYDALRYCNWLSQKAGIARDQWCYPEEIGPGMKIEADAYNRPGFRLPTEAEWEYFGRAGTETRRPFGNSEEELNRHGWTYLNSRGVLHPSAQLLPNEFGLFDTLGSLWEWCHDGPSQDDLYPAYPSGTKEQPAIDKVEGVPLNKQDWRIVRGGLFDATPGVARSAHRDIIRADRRLYSNGFRPVRTLVSDK